MSPHLHPAVLPAIPGGFHPRLCKWGAGQHVTHIAHPKTRSWGPRAPSPAQSCGDVQGDSRSSPILPPAHRGAELGPLPVPNKTPKEKVASTPQLLPKTPLGSSPRSLWVQYGVPPGYPTLEPPRVVRSRVPVVSANDYENWRQKRPSWQPWTLRCTISPAQHRLEAGRGWGGLFWYLMMLHSTQVGCGSGWGPSGTKLLLVPGAGACGTLGMGVPQRIPRPGGGDEQEGLAAAPPAQPLTPGRFPALGNVGLGRTPSADLPHPGTSPHVPPSIPLSMGPGGAPGGSLALPAPRSPRAQCWGSRGCRWGRCGAAMLSTC